MAQHSVGNVRPALLVLLGAVGFGLLLACGTGQTCAEPALARAAARSKEIAVRNRARREPERLIRQLLTESLLALARRRILGCSWLLVRPLRGGGHPASCRARMRSGIDAR